MTKHQPTRSDTSTQEVTDYYERLKSELDELTNKASSDPDYNHAKIKFLKEEIASGRYQIQDDAIAEKLLEHSEEPTKEPEESELA